jgi:hypothetical protein
MACPFYKEEPRLRCMIHKEYLYAPSTFQLREYCASERHAICPLFSKRSPDDGGAAHPAKERYPEGGRR